LEEAFFTNGELDPPTLEKEEEKNRDEKDDDE
jgi:hypothetical protein